MAHGKWSEIEVRSVLEAWRRSGLTLERFAKQRGFGPQRLRWWQAKFARAAKSKALAPLPALLPIRVSAEPERRNRPATPVVTSARFDVQFAPAQAAGSNSSMAFAG